MRLYIYLGQTVLDAEARGDGAGRLPCCHSAPDLCSGPVRGVYQPLPGIQQHEPVVMQRSSNSWGNSVQAETAGR